MVVRQAIVGWTAAFALVCTLTWLAACGGGGNGVTVSPTPVATPTPGPVRTVVGQGSFALCAPTHRYTYFSWATITTRASGTLDTTVDWTYATNTLFMYMADGECTGDQFASDDCPGPACACKFSVTSEAQTPKPRVLSVPNAAAGTRTLIVWNQGPTEESCSYQAVLTTTGATATATARGSAGLEVRAKRIPTRLFGGR